MIYSSIVSLSGAYSNVCCSYSASAYRIPTLCCNNHSECFPQRNTADGNGWRTGFDEASQDFVLEMDVACND